METSLLISLKLNFTPNTLGCYGLIYRYGERHTPDFPGEQHLLCKYPSMVWADRSKVKQRSWSYRYEWAANTPCWKINSTQQVDKNISSDKCRPRCPTGRNMLTTSPSGSLESYSDAIYTPSFAVKIKGGGRCRYRR